MRVKSMTRKTPRSISVCVIDNSGDIREVEGAPYTTCERSLEEADKEAQQNAGKPPIVNQSASDVPDDVVDFVASLEELGDVARGERGVIVKCAGRGGDMYVCYSDHSLVNTCFNWYGPGQGISEIAYVHFDPQYRFSGDAGDPDQWTAAGCGDFRPVDDLLRCRHRRLPGAPRASLRCRSLGSRGCDRALVIFA